MQTVSTNALEALKEEHFRIGFWDRKSPQEKYRYVLSPDRFLLTHDLQNQLAEVGQGVRAYLDGLTKLTEDINKRQGNHALGVVRSLVKKGLNGFPLYQQANEVPFSKVDLMIDQNNNLNIGEIDVYNPRGLAYFQILRHLYKKFIDPDASMLPGVANEIKKHKDRLTWVYAERERYHERPLSVAAKLFRDTGVDFKTERGSEVKILGKNQLIIPYGMAWKAEREVGREMLKEYEKHPQRYLYPPVPWTQSKGFMAIVSNTSKNSLTTELSTMMNEANSNIELLSKYLPPTILVGKKFKKEEVLEFREKFPGDIILKENVSSGMKGICRYDDPNFFQILERGLNQKKPDLIAQQLIKQKKFDFDCFADNQIETDSYYIRLIIYFNKQGYPVDAVVTARKSPDVHGAVDCLQLPCVLE